MTVPKVNTITRGGSRFYVNPETGEKVPGVTSIVSMLPKGFLKFWAAKTTAQAAVDHLGEVVGIALRSGPETAVDFLKRAPDRDVNAAADAGTAAHDVFEALANGQPVGRLAPSVQVYADHFKSFLDKVQPQILHTEQTVWSQTHDYAGSFDAFGIVDGIPTWLDWKTTRSGVHEEVALQLAAYANADFIIEADGAQHPLPKGDAGAVLHVRPEGWALVPVNISAEVFGHFLALRKTFTWEHDHKRNALGPAAYTSDEPAPAKPKPGNESVPAEPKVRPSARIAAARKKAGQ